MSIQPAKSIKSITRESALFFVTIVLLYHLPRNGNFTFYFSKVYLADLHITLLLKIPEKDSTQQDLT